MQAEKIKTIHRACPICLSLNSTTSPGRYSRDGWTVIDCDTCGFVYLPVVPVAEELEVNLAWEKTYAAEKMRRKKKQPIVQWLGAKLRWRLHIFPRTEGVDILNKKAPPGPALDLGCGSGVWLKRFDDSFVPYGIEVSQSLAAEAQAAIDSRGGKIVQASSAKGLEQFPDEFFTAVLLRSYLEHDWEAREVIHNLFKKTAPGGMIVIKVPNYGSINRMVMGQNWCGFRLPDHVNYFDMRHLRQLAEGAGFKVVFPPMNCLPTDDNFVAILTK